MYGVVLLERLTGTHIFSKVVAAFFVQVGRAIWKGKLEGLRRMCCDAANFGLILVLEVKLS